MSTTKTVEDLRWVVDVVDPRDPEKGYPGYTRRFTFEGEDAAQRAWVVCAKAEKAGFKAIAEKVRRV